MALFKFTKGILNKEPIDIYNNGHLDILVSARNPYLTYLSQISILENIGSPVFNFSNYSFNNAVDVIADADKGDSSIDILDTINFKIDA